MTQNDQSVRMSFEEYGPLLNVNDVVSLLGVSTRTIYRFTESGELPCVKVGRRLYFPREKLFARLGIGSFADPNAFGGDVDE